MMDEVIKLNKPQGKNRYCGPAVISILTGIRTDDAAWFIRHFSKQKFVKSAWAKHVLLVLNHFGFIHYDQPKACGKTLIGWARSRPKNDQRVYLVVAGHHFQLVRGQEFICGITRELVPLTHEKVKRRARVRSVYELNLPDGLWSPQLLTDRKEEQRRKRQESLQRSRVKKEVLAMAEELNLSIDEDYLGGGEYHRYVYAPEAVEEAMGIDSHIFYDWTEALDRCKEIKEFTRAGVCVEARPLGQQKSNELTLARRSS